MNGDIVIAYTGHHSSHDTLPRGFEKVRIRRRHTMQVANSLQGST